MKNIYDIMQEQGLLRSQMTESGVRPPVHINNKIWDTTAGPVNEGIRDLYELAKDKLRDDLHLER